MWLTDLADACRKSGLNVIETAAWRTRGHGPMNGVRAIACHHTAGPATGEAPSLNVVRDGRPGLEGPLSHLVLGRSGAVYVIAAGLCWHTGATFHPDQGNAWAIGIEAEATGTSGWPAVQYQAYARLCRALADHYGLPLSRVLGHKEIASPLGRKIDPNFSMSDFRIAVSQAAPPVPPQHTSEDVMYIKCGDRVAILTGPFFVGLGTAGELASAEQAIARGATVQWVEEGTWDDLDARSHALYGHGLGIPVRVAP